MRSAGAALAILALFLLHQDVWFWTTARPLMFGLLPAGLWYHAVYAVATALLMWWLVRTIWPAHLEHDPDHAASGRPPDA